MITFVPMQILDGKLVSQAVKDQLKTRVSQRLEAGKKKPHLAAILVGNDGASQTYVNFKVKDCAEVGFESTLIRLENSISEEELLNTIKKLNQDAGVDGILVQLPLPDHISNEKVINAIDPSKDVDGFHPISMGRLVAGNPVFIPATPYGIMLLLEHYKIKTSGLKATIVGRSNIVGTPMSLLLSRNTPYGNCTVTLCHSRTKDVKAICRDADLVVAALGRPEFLTADMVKEGAIIIDVGITRVEDSSRKRGYRLVGDVKFDEVSKKCSYITPVPGGVGPMTRAALLKNTYHAALSHDA